MAWSDGLAYWTEGDTAYVSLVFTWRIHDARKIALWQRALGRKVVAGGPGLFKPKLKAMISDLAEVRSDYAEAVTRHNSLATFASRGCPVGCAFCIVPKMEGAKFTLLPDFTPRPILCDNNLSALPFDYQEHIVRKYTDAGVPLKDANSGFEPRTFTEDVYRLWKPLNQGPWRFAYDDMPEGGDVQRTMRMLESEPQKKKRVYVLVGNEPFSDCMMRIRQVIEGGCEPPVQPEMPLDAIRKEPVVKFDWDRQTLTDVARWANGWVWKKVPFEQYDRSRRS